MTQRWCKSCGGWHDLDEPWPVECLPKIEYKRSSMHAPYYISDGLDYVQSMVDGRYYTSKSELRASYRAHGVVEVGNDPQRFKPPTKPKPDRKAIKEAIQKARARYERGERVRNH